MLRAEPGREYNQSESVSQVFGRCLTILLFKSHLQKQNTSSAHSGILVCCRKRSHFHLSSEGFCIVRVPHDRHQNKYIFNVKESPS